MQLGRILSIWNGQYAWFLDNYCLLFLRPSLILLSSYLFLPSAIRMQWERSSDVSRGRQVGTVPQSDISQQRVVETPETCGGQIEICMVPVIWENRVIILRWSESLLVTLIMNTRYYFRDLQTVMLPPTFKRVSLHSGKNAALKRQSVCCVWHSS